MTSPRPPAPPHSTGASILASLGLSRTERALGVLLVAVVVGGLTLGKISASEAATMLVALTGMAAAISTARKTGAEAANTYADAAQKAIEQANGCLEMKNGLQEEIDELRRNVETPRQKLAQKDDRVRVLSQQNERMRTRLDEKDKSILSLETQVSILIQSVQQKDQRIADLESHKQLQDEKIAALKAELEQLRAGR